MTDAGLTPVQAFATTFCGIGPRAAWLIVPGDGLHEKWEPAISWGLDYARARRGKTRTLVADTAEAMALRPLVEGQVYADPDRSVRWEPAVAAMIQAAQRAAREQGRGA